MSQLSAVTGRKIRPDNVARINTQTPYLPQIYGMKEDQRRQQLAEDQQGITNEFNQKQLALSRENFAMQQRIAEENAAMAREALANEKKQTEQANKIGFGNIALAVGTGAAKSGLFDRFFPPDEATEAIKPSLSMFSGVSGGGTSESVIPGPISKPFMDMKTPSVFQSAGKDMVSSSSSWMDGVKGSFTDNLLPTLGGGGVGAFAGKAIGKDNDLVAGLSGAAIGGLTSYLTSGKDLWSGVFGATLGGLGALFL